MASLRYDKPEYDDDSDDEMSKCIDQNELLLQKVKLISRECK